MSQKYSEYVEDCLHRLDRGEDLLDLLADFPDCQEKLKPLLLVAMASRSFPVPVPNHTAQRLGKNQMLEEMEILRSHGAFRKNPQIPPVARLMGNLVSAVRSRGFSRLAPSYRLAMVALMLVMSGGFLTLNASAASQPGDWLYTLKLGMERVQLALTFNPEPSHDNSDQMTEEMDLAVIELYDVLRDTNKSIWVIKGITIQLNQDGGTGRSIAAIIQQENSPTYAESPPEFDVMEDTSNEQVAIADTEPKDKDKDEDKDEDKDKDKDQDKDSTDKGKAGDKDNDDKLKSKEDKLMDKEDKKK